MSFNFITQMRIADYNPICSNRMKISEATNESNLFDFVTWLTDNLQLVTIYISTQTKTASF